MRIRTYFKGAKLVRMSNGDYCVVRELGLVPGGKGMRHHENLLRLTPAGLASELVGFTKSLFKTRQMRLLGEPHRAAQGDH